MIGKGYRFWYGSEKQSALKFHVYELIAYLTANDREQSLISCATFKMNDSISTLCDLHLRSPARIIAF